MEPRTLCMLGKLSTWVIPLALVTSDLSCLSVKPAPQDRSRPLGQKFTRKFRCYNGRTLSLVDLWSCCLRVGRFRGCLCSPCMAATSSLRPFLQAEGQLQHPGRRQSQLAPARTQALPGQSRSQLGSPAPCPARVSGDAAEVGLG